jgi:hypothetical protein
MNPKLGSTVLTYTRNPKAQTESIYIFEKFWFLTMQFGGGFAWFFGKFGSIDPDLFGK